MVLGAYREGVELLELSVHGLQQREVAGDAALGHSENRVVIVQKEVELGVLRLYTALKKERFIINTYTPLSFQLLNASVCFS